MTTKIFAISGISGAGKTTLATELAKKLEATAIYWDDFDEISTSPEDYVAWYKSEQDFEAWDYSALAKTLNTLKEGQALYHPALNQLLIPTKYIVFDAPLGRLHQQTGQHIDVWVHLDTPLDIALARRTIRDFQRDPRPVSEVLEDLQYYLEHSRPLFFDEKQKQGADIIIDGKLTIGEQLKLLGKLL